MATASPSAASPAFEIRSTQDCGWNLFLRKGRSLDPGNLGVNERFLDHLHEAGLNWLFVFWTHSPAFDDAWAAASEYAHALGIRLARAVYVFAGSETGEEFDPRLDTMGEPDVPARLLRTSRRGTRTALCPHDAETRAWVSKAFERRLEPGIDGILFEPPSGLSEECACEQCRALGRFALDTLMAQIVTEETRPRRPDLELMLHFNASSRLRSGQGGRFSRRGISYGLRDLPVSIRFIFGWLTEMTGTDTDNEESLVDWLDADPRFQAYTRLSRAILFPDGKASGMSIEDRTATAFRWARLAADRGKKAYSYDWRLFGGTEWAGHEHEAPTTRICRRLPASLALMGATLRQPWLDRKEQSELLARLRATAEWDLDDPAAFYRGL
jgi:hypothetical protein